MSDLHSQKEDGGRKEARSGQREREGGKEGVGEEGVGWGVWGRGLAREHITDSYALPFNVLISKAGNIMQAVKLLQNTVPLVHICSCKVCRRKQ